MDFSLAYLDVYSLQKCFQMIRINTSRKVSYWWSIKCLWHQTKITSFPSEDIALELELQLLFLWLSDSILPLDSMLKRLILILIIYFLELFGKVSPILAKSFFFQVNLDVTKSKGLFTFCGQWVLFHIP